jgi:hypothetical protein
VPTGDDIRNCIIDAASIAVDSEPKIQMMARLSAINVGLRKLVVSSHHHDGVGRIFQVVRFWVPDSSFASNRCAIGLR